ncbi:MAG: hypothetical protein AAF846_03480 [Chloroflexota bacterium]
MRRLVVILFLVFCTVGYTQEIHSDAMTITSENVTQLQSTNQLSFDATISNDIQVGWFALQEENNHLVLIADNNVLIINDEGLVTKTVEAIELIDTVSFADKYVALLYTLPNGFGLSYTNTEGSSDSIIEVETSTIPSTLWVECNGASKCTAFAESITNQGETVLIELPSFDSDAVQGSSIRVNISELAQSPYTPALDEDAVVRIGRIPLPYVVTSSLDGIVQLWNLSTNELTYEVDNGTGQPSVFGNINVDATHLVWRDNANETLYLLNFETGENQAIAPLNGEYAQWYFLSNDASVIIAVNLGGEPNIVAWDTTTGERTDLGIYRECNRPQPDMVRLSDDGSTLVIGCDTGLDIWQIVEES